MSCKPERHYIPMGKEHRIEVTAEGRYIPQYWIPNPMPPEKRPVWSQEDGFWESLLMPGFVRFSLVQARNDCAAHAGLKTV